MAHPLVAPAKALGGIPASFPDSPADTERSGAESRQDGARDPHRSAAPTADPDALFEAFAAWAEERGLTLYPHQEEALIEVVSGANVILVTPTGSGKSLVAAGAHFAALARGRAHLLHRADQGAGVGEVLRPVRDLRHRERRHDDRRRQRQPRRADHLLHRRGAGQHRAARRRRRRRRPGRDGRVPLLRRAGPRLGLAGAAARAAAGAVRADVGDARRRHAGSRRT